MTLATHIEYEIIAHGYEHSQCFSGCGVAYSEFSDVVTGAGITEREAFEDAVEQIESIIGGPVSIPGDPDEINGEAILPADLIAGEDEEQNVYFYVSIRFNAP